MAAWPLALALPLPETAGGAPCALHAIAYRTDMVPLRALLFTDIVDSTKLAQAVGDAEMTRLWAAHDRAARDLLPHWRGREIDKADGMLLLFDVAADAAGYALDYHRALARLGLPFKARAGLHVGPVTLRSNSSADIAIGAKPVEVEGLAKPVAARVMAVAAGGQTLLTDEARHQLDGAGLRVQSHGHWRLTGVSEPVELFEVGDDNAPFVPPSGTPKAYRVVYQGELWVPEREIKHSLPAERDSFVGRQELLQALARMLQGDARLVSVLGMGGSGKTRLAMRFGRAWLGDYPGGVWFCDLSQARSLDGIALAVAQGLGVSLGRTDPVDQLAHAIAGRVNCLVILDNFEQVVPWAEASVGRWIERAAQARFLVTSRERLGIVGERTLEVAPLSADDAAALFMLRAEAIQHAYRPVPDDQAAIAKLVRILDGLPLAVELAAARVRVMPPSAMLTHMHKRFDVLKARTGRHDRQATLRATFDWSWELLAEAEKVALAQLSVFRGGFNVDSAGGVLDSTALDNAPQAVDTLLGLLDKSFVRVVEEGRFDLLESVREYADEHLRTAGRFVGSGPEALRATECRHGAYFAALGPDRAVEQRCVELDNLVAACQRAVARGDIPVAANALAGAWGAIERQGPFRLGVELADAVRAMPGLGGRAKVQVELIGGRALQLCGRAVEAEGLMARAASGAYALGDLEQEGLARHGLAAMQSQSGRIEEAAASFDRALALLRQVGDRSAECAVLNALGSFYESRGLLKDARQHYENGLQLARGSGNRRWEGGSAGNLAQFHANQGRIAEALPLYEQAVHIARELGNRQWEADARCNLGLLHFAEGRWPAAQAELESALAAAREMGHAHLLSVVQCNLGLVAEALGEPEDAHSYHEAAVALSRDRGDRRSEGQFLGYLGLLHARQARFALARECLTTGEALLDNVADRISLGILLCARAEAEYLADQEQAANDALARADQLAKELPDVEPESEFGKALARSRSVLGAPP